MKIRLNLFFIDSSVQLQIAKSAFAFNKLTTDDSKAKKILKLFTKQPNLAI